MKNSVDELLHDKLDETDYTELVYLTNKYHCDGAFYFGCDPMGLSYGLFWAGVLAGSASAKLEMHDYDLCVKAQCVISEELREMLHSYYSM